MIIECGDFAREIWVKSKNINLKALDGSEVVFSILPGQDLKNHMALNQSEKEEAKSEVPPTSKPRLRRDHERIFARILHVLNSPYEKKISYLKIYRDKNNPSIFLGRCVYKKKYPEFHIDQESIEKFNGNVAGRYFISQYTEWNSSKKAAIVRLNELIGEEGDIPSEFKCLGKTTYVELIDYDKSTESQIRKELNFPELKENYEVSQENMEGRLDLREMLTFSVGSEHSLSNRNAFSIINKGKGKIQIGFHVPDVSFFSNSGSLLDESAKQRMNGFKAPHENYEMLPQFLMDGPLTLLPGKARLTVSLFFTVDEQGLIIDDSVDVKRSVIQVSAYLSHNVALDMINDRITAFPSHLKTFSMKL